MSPLFAVAGDIVKEIQYLFPTGVQVTKQLTYVPENRKFFSTSMFTESIS